MTKRQKAWLKRILIGGILGGGMLLLLCGLINMIALGSVVRPFTLVGHRAREVFGNAALPAFLTVGFSFGVGAAVGVGTLPFAGTGMALAKRSALHFAVTAFFLLALGGVCFWYENLMGAVVLFGFCVFLYLAVWLVRWLGWRAELNELRSALHLPVPSPAAFHLGESLPYALLLAGFFLLLRPLAEVLDAVDVPVLRALILPWLAYPFIALLVGWVSGRARGFCPLVPLTAFAAFLPNLLWTSVPYCWEQGLVYAALALGANLIGAAWNRCAGKWRGRKDKPQWN